MFFNGRNDANHFEPNISIVETNEAVKLGPEVSGRPLTYEANFNADKYIVKQENRLVSAPATSNHNGLMERAVSEVSNVLDLTTAGNTLCEFFFVLVYIALN